jgi:peptide/nickel transport system substrate-binding protein
MNRKRKLIGLVAALPLLLTVACSGEPAGSSNEELGQDAASDNREARDGGELTVALAEEPDALDPSLARTFVGRMVFANMCEKLYDANADLDRATP